MIVAQVEVACFLSQRPQDGIEVAVAATIVIVIASHGEIAASAAWRTEAIDHIQKALLRFLRSPCIINIAEMDGMRRMRRGDLLHHALRGWLARTPVRKQRNYGVGGQIVPKTTGILVGDERMFGAG